MKKLIVLTVLASLGATLAGCDATTMSAPGNTTLASTALGAATGATIGALAHDDDRGAGAVVGGLVGAGTGALVGSAMERNRNAAYGTTYVQPAPAPVVVAPAPAPVVVAPPPRGPLVPGPGPIPPPHVY